MADRWYYVVGEERRGPVEKGELLRMLDEVAAEKKKAAAA